MKFLNRSVFFYALVFLGISWLVDGKISQAKREKYLLGIFFNGDLKNYYDGILYFDSMINHFPNRAEYYEGLGRCYLNLKKYDQALSAYQKADFLIDLLSTQQKEKVNQSGSEDIKTILRMIEERLDKTQTIKGGT